MFKIKSAKLLTYIIASVFMQEEIYMVIDRCPVQMGSWDIPIRNGKRILLGALQGTGNAHRN